MPATVTFLPTIYLNLTKNNLTSVDVDENDLVNGGESGEMNGWQLPLVQFVLALNSNDLCHCDSGPLNDVFWPH